MLRNTIEIPGITFGKLPYFKTLWNYLTHPWAIFGNALNQFRYISFIIFDTSVKHLLQAMSHAPWFMAHDSSHARSVHSHPVVHGLWLNRLRLTFELQAHAQGETTHGSQRKKGSLRCHVEDSLLIALSSMVAVANIWTTSEQSADHLYNLFHISANSLIRPWTSLKKLLQYSLYSWTPFANTSEHLWTLCETFETYLTTISTHMKHI